MRPIKFRGILKDSEMAETDNNKLVSDPLCKMNPCPLCGMTTKPYKEIISDDDLDNGVRCVCPLSEITDESLYFWSVKDIQANASQHGARFRKSRK